MTNFKVYEYIHIILYGRRKGERLVRGTGRRVNTNYGLIYHIYTMCRYIDIKINLIMNIYIYTYIYICVCTHVCMYVNKVPCRNDGVSFLNNPNKRRPIAHQLGRQMGCVLWIETWIMCCPS